MKSETTSYFSVLQNNNNQLQNTLTVSADTLQWTARAGRNLSPRSTLILQPSVQWYPLQQMVNPAVALSELISLF